MAARRHSTPLGSSGKGRRATRPGPRPRLPGENSGRLTSGARRGRGPGRGGAAQAPPQACPRGRAAALAAPPGRGSPRPCCHCEGEGRRGGGELRGTPRPVPGGPASRSSSGTAGRASPPPARAGHPPLGPYLRSRCPAAPASAAEVPPPPSLNSAALPTASGLSIALLPEGGPSSRPLLRNAPSNRLLGRSSGAGLLLPPR